MSSRWLGRACVRNCEASALPFGVQIELTAGTIHTYFSDRIVNSNLDTYEWQVDRSVKRMDGNELRGNGSGQLSQWVRYGLIIQNDRFRL